MNLFTKLCSSLQLIFKEQKEKRAGNSEQFAEIGQIVRLLKEGEVNQNFEGTLHEIQAYADTVKKKNISFDRHVQFHELNLSRWIRELSLLQDGGGAVTIDYEQRRGREI